MLNALEMQDSIFLERKLRQVVSIHMNHATIGLIRCSEDVLREDLRPEADYDRVIQYAVCSVFLELNKRLCKIGTHVRLSAHIRKRKAVFFSISLI